MSAKPSRRSGSAPPRWRSAAVGLACLLCLLLPGCGDDHGVGDPADGASAAKSRPARLADPPAATTSESVGRLELGDGAVAAVEAAGETRPARLLAPPSSTRICAPAAPGAERVLSLGLRADAPGARARLEPEGGEPLAAALDTRWSELRLPLPEQAGCVTLVLVGPATVRVAVSRPRIERSGARRSWVVLYVVDTLRFDATPWGGAPVEVAPSFAAFARDAVLYRRAFSVASWTRPSVATLLTGRGPVEHGVFDRQDRLAAGLPRLPERLADAGWATVAVSTNPNVLPLWGFLGGFDRFVDVEADGWTHREGLARLPDTVDAILGDAADVPLFLYVHDNGPHAPWAPPAEARERFGAPPAGHPAEAVGSVDDPEPVKEARRRLYQASIRDTSDRFAALLARLRALGRYDEALIVLVGDHGEEFGDHGGVSHGRTLYQEQLHVPLAVKLPGNARGGTTVEAPVSTSDVAATVLEALGLAAGDTVPGRSLPTAGGAPESAGPLFAELDLDGHRAEAVVSWPWKYLEQGAAGARLFDLVSDPQETRDASGDAPDVLERLRATSRVRRAAARSGLWLDCVAGERRARVVLELASDHPLAFEPVGLEARDQVAERGGALQVVLDLRPAASFSEVQLLDVRAMARSQPDRDRLRLQAPEGGAVTVRAGGDPVRLESGSGEPLSGDGSPVPLARLAADERVAAPAPGRTPVCRLTYREPRAERLPEEGMDPALRERLRALGYLEEEPGP